MPEEATREPGTHAAINAVRRIEAARIIAAVARLVRDVGVAEELAQDALIAVPWASCRCPNPVHWRDDGAVAETRAALAETGRTRCAAWVQTACRTGEATMLTTAYGPTVKVKGFTLIDAWQRPLSRVGAQSRHANAVTSK